jgi:hypothetical protein
MKLRPSKSGLRLLGPAAIAAIVWLGASSQALAAAPTQPSPSQPPSGAPAFSVTVQKIGIADASTYMIGGNFVRLFGVVDPKPVSAQHQASLTQELHEILGSQTLTCYQKKGAVYQCFINEHDDFALLLLRRGLVVPANDAPPEYLAPAQH